MEVGVCSSRIKLGQSKYELADMNWSETLSRLEPETAARAAAFWNADAGSLEFVSQSANAVYKFSSNGEVRFVRLVHHELREHAFLAAGLDFLNHAWLAGAFVCQSLLSSRGCFIEDVLQSDDVFLATVTTGVAGQTLGEVSESNRLEAVFEFGVNDSQDLLLKPAQVQAWGHALGTLHAASESYQAVPVRFSSGMVQFPESFSLQKFWANIKAVCSSDPDLERVHGELGAWLETLPISEMIVTHGDFRSGNAIWDGTRVTILDFDEPVLAWAEYDVARTLLQDECDPFPNLEQHLAHFLVGYERARALPHVQSRIKNFVRVRALLMLAWSLEDSSWGDETGMVLLKKIAIHGLEWNST
jgi:Ser/Thr protein kinase RdoA (MazF antagonist)